MRLARTWMTCLLLAACAKSSAPEAQPEPAPEPEGPQRFFDGQTWTPASSTPAGLTSVADLDRFQSVTLTASASSDSTGLSGLLALHGNQPQTCAEVLADGMCPDFEPFGYAELGR